jgi:hypothetical protein
MSGFAPADRSPSGEHWMSTLRRWLTVELVALGVVAGLAIALTALTGDVSRERVGFAFAVAGLGVGVLGLAFCFQRFGATQHYRVFPGHTPTMDLELAAASRRWAEINEVMLLTFPVSVLLLLTASLLGAGR